MNRQDVYYASFKDPWNEKGEHLIAKERERKRSRNEVSQKVRRATCFSLGAVYKAILITIETASLYLKKARYPMSRIWDIVNVFRKKEYFFRKTDKPHSSPT